MKSIQQLREKYVQLKSEVPSGTPVAEGYAVLLSYLERSKTLQEAREFVATSLASGSVQDEDAKRMYRQFLVEAGVTDAKEGVEAYLQRLQRDNANVPEEDQSFYPEIGAINSARSILHTSPTASVFLDRLKEKRDEVYSQETENQAYQAELVNWYDVIIGGTGEILGEPQPDA